MNKKIPLKNYILLGVILLVTIILVIYIYMWNKTYKEAALQTKIMDEYLQVINYNELDNYLIENKNATIYCSVLEDKTIRSFEKKFKNVIKKYSLNNEILYLDLTEELKNKKTNNELKEKYITAVPSIIVYKDGNLYKMYNIKENDYSINSLVDFLEEEEIIND